MFGDSGIITEAQWGSFSSEMQNIIEQVQTEQLRIEASSTEAKHLKKISIEEAQNFDKTLKQEILCILDLMPKDAKREDYPEDLLNQRADEQGYLRDIFYVEIDGVSKEKYIYDSLRGVVYKKSGASVGFYTMYSYKYGCKQRGIEILSPILNKTVEHDSELKQINGVYAYEPDVKGFQDSTIKTVYVHAKTNTNGTIASVGADTENKEYIYAAAPVQSFEEEENYKYIWYDYKNKIWANIHIKANGVESYWVWIPRYAYKIENSAVDIKFVNLNNQYYNTSTNQWTDIEEGYLVAAAFEQDRNLKGIWMAKYDASIGQINYEVSTAAEAANPPKSDGFDQEKTYYVTYDSAGKETVVGPIGTTEAPEDWYDYTNKRWANIKTVNTAEDGQVLESYWVWIPRYAYTVVNGAVDIVFVDTNNQPLDPKYNGMYSIGSNDSNAQFKVPTAFDQDGALEGIWMSKYDASPLTVNFEKSTEKTAVCAPKLDGFDETKTYYVTYENNTEKVGSLISEPAPDNWYDYTNKQWANIKTENTIDGIKVETMWVWVPRYAYREEGGVVNIIYVDADNNPLDSKYEGMYTIGSQESDAQFKVPAAFDQDGALEGIWMSKYDASKVELTN